MNSLPIMRREWAMPSADTFDVPCIGQFVQRYLAGSKVSVDPFSRNRHWTTYTNDLNPNTSAEYHMDAEEFLLCLRAQSILCDVAVFDPPYSPRQIRECYQEIGRPCTMRDTQNSGLYSRVRSALTQVLNENSIVLSFGWNSAGMGKKHGFEIMEILLVCHGGAHNDTICMAERCIQPRLI